LWDKELTMKSWALKWLEGSLISFVRGSTHLNLVIGRIEKCIKSYGVKVDEVKAMIEAIEQNPAYLPTLPAEEKIARLKPMKDVLERMRRGEWASWKESLLP